MNKSETAGIFKVGVLVVKNPTPLLLQIPLSAPHPNPSPRGEGLKPLTVLAFN